MTALPLSSTFLIGSRRSLRLIERNIFVYRHGWLILLSGFFEPLFYLLSIGFGLGALIGDVPGPDGQPISYQLFMVVMAVLGLIVSPWVILAFPAALLVGFAFGAVGMAATSFMKTWQDFDLIQLVILPLFLFSATFYPLSTYPPALQLVVRLTPLYQGVDLIRSLTVGAIGPDLLVHVVYLTVMGMAGLVVVSRRLDQLLLK